MAKVKIYTTGYCPYCDAAKSFLQAKEIPYEEIDVSSPDERMVLKKRTGWMTVPQIFINDQLIGGYQELVALEQAGELKKKLSD